MNKTFSSAKTDSSDAVAETIHFLKEQGRVLTIAESCTAGEVCSLIANVSGCGSVLYNGYVVYNEQAKQECLGVRAETIEKFGLTSEEVAREMALGALNNHKPTADRNLGTGRPNMSVAITGTAESDDEQDGVVCFAYAAMHDDDVVVYTETIKFEAPRNEVRREAAHHAILSLPDFCQRLRLRQSSSD